MMTLGRPRHCRIRVQSPPPPANSPPSRPRRRAGAAQWVPAIATERGPNGATDEHQRAPVARESENLGVWRPVEPLCLTSRTRQLSRLRDSLTEPLHRPVLGHGRPAPDTEALAPRADDKHRPDAVHASRSHRINVLAQPPCHGRSVFPGPSSTLFQRRTAGRRVTHDRADLGYGPARLAQLNHRLAKLNTRGGRGPPPVIS